MQILGIDPAPSKTTVACIGTPEAVQRWERWEPLAVPAEVEARVRKSGPVLALWDAPLGLDAGHKRYSSRIIDAAARRWVDKNPLIERGAVGVANASGCPHNLLTQAAWGVPVGSVPHHGLTLLDANTLVGAEGRWLAETHPAVALAVWWARLPSAAALPRYKPGGGVNTEDAATNLRRVLAGLETVLADGPRPSDAPKPSDRNGREVDWTDDHLDAWISWRLGVDLLQGRAHAVGPAGGGSYVLPIEARLEAGSRPTLRVRS